MNSSVETFNNANREAKNQQQKSGLTLGLFRIQAKKVKPMD
jgi:hypothetical protein